MQDDLMIKPYNGEFSIGNRAISKFIDNQLVTIEDIFYSTKNNCWMFEYSEDENILNRTMTVEDFDERYKLLYN